MKIVLAFDKFKGVATSREVAMAARDAILGVVPDAQVVLIPCADGGEGTMEALSPAHSQRVSVEVCGPLPDMRVNAAYTISHGTAVIEMAAASGLALLADSQRDVMHATTRGTGMLFRHAIAQGAQRVTLGIGGSATNDCGMGILSALGFRFLDQQGRELAPCGATLAKVARLRCGQSALRHAWCGGGLCSAKGRVGSAGDAARRGRTPFLPVHAWWRG